MPYQIRKVSWEQEKDNLKAVREKVFVCEWRIPRHQEFDKQDTLARHILVCDSNDQPVATGRLLANGQISRVAVVMSERDNDIGLQVINALIDIAKSMKMTEVFINSQLSDVSFYQQQGFKACGAVYMEAGLPMQKMTCSIKKCGLREFHQTH